MTDERAARTVNVVHGHVRGAAADHPRVRARLFTVLDRADLAPPRLPPSAILLVRRAAVRVPAGALASGAARSGGQRWEREGRDRLGTALAQAATPVDGRIAPSADAVVFADRAELLACLALDLRRGVAGRRWWWAAWSRSVGGARSVPDTLGDDITLLPAVLDTLDTWGAATEVLASVPPADAVRLLRRVAQVFDLHASEQSVVDAARTGATPVVDLSGQAPSGGARRDLADLADDATIACAEPVWSSALGRGTVPAHLAPEAAALLAVALLLVRAPRVLRAPGIRAILHDPAQHATATGVADGANAAGSVPRRRSRRRAPQPQVLVAHPGSPTTSPDRDTAGSAPREAPADPVEPSELGPASLDLPGGTEGTAAGANVHGGGAVGSPERRPPGPDAADAADAAGALGAGRSRDVPVEARSRDGVATRLAGIGYLVNLLGPLRPDEVSDPAWRLDELTGWALVELLARGLLDDPDAHDLASTPVDPLWPLLAELDGRALHDPLGSAAVAAPAAAIPDVWLQDAATHRVELPPTVPVGPLVTRSVLPGTAAWLAAALPYLRWRLRDALGGIDVSDVLRVRGRWLVTRTHVDVVIPLAQVSIAARRAGLDRDPGWVPRLGRVVSFRFVEESDP